MFMPDNIPDTAELEERRKPKYIIDPEHVKPKDDTRIRQWGLAIMKKHESRFKNKTPHGKIVYEKELEPEEIDIRNIYPFSNLYYFIMKEHDYWVLRLCCVKPTDNKSIILAQLTYTQI